MEWLEIALLLLGGAVFVISFFIPEKNGKDQNGSELSSDKIKEIVEEECENAKSRLQDMTDETVTYSLEKAERAMERLTNEKMLAMGEYSDTIMSQINTNHQETVFMYDMLTNSKEGLTKQLSEAQVQVREVLMESKEASETALSAKSASETAEQVALEAMKVANEAKEQAVVAEETMVRARKNIQGDSESAKIVTNLDGLAKASEVAESAMPEEKKKTTKRKPRATKKEDVAVEELLPVNEEISIQFAPGEENGLNNNEKILKLHKQGKSNMAIAKELGLGIGEVKLVIDLFEKK